MRWILVPPLASHSSNFNEKRFSAKSNRKWENFRKIECRGNLYQIYLSTDMQINKIKSFNFARKRNLIRSRCYDVILSLGFTNIFMWIYCRHNCKIGQKFRLTYKLRYKILRRIHTCIISYAFVLRPQLSEQTKHFTYTRCINVTHAKSTNSTHSIQFVSFRSLWYRRVVSETQYMTATDLPTTGNQRRI